MKKIAIMTAAAALFLFGTALAGCGKDQSACAHEWEEISMTATCEEAGILTRKCKLCEKEEQREVAALGHDMQEKENIPATCDKAGKVTRECSRCDKKEEETVGALGHAWEEEIVEPATCTQTGMAHKHCTRCGDDIDEPLPILPHELGGVIVAKSTSATCTKSGIEVKHCKLCDQDIETETKPLGHDFSNSGTLTKDATCTEPGEREYVCARKNCDGGENGQPATEKREIPVLGHDWQAEFTLDKEPTFESAGSRSIHCNRCEERQSTEEVPKLEQGKKTTYELFVARPNGEALTQSTIKVTVKDKAGDIVAVSDTANFKDGVMTVELFPDTYTATVEGLPGGYYAQASYTIAPGNVVKQLTVNAKLLPAAEANDKTTYARGSVMHDYTFTTIDGKTVTLGELLKNKKMVLFNFFFADCTFCKQEMPALLSAYSLYKDDVAIVMLDIMNYDTPADIRSKIVNEYHVPTSVYVVQDATLRGGEASDYNNIYQKFKITSAPQNIVIDCEGVVAYKSDGAMEEATFLRLMRRFTAAPYWFDTENAQAAAQTAAPISYPAILPGKRFSLL